MGSLINKGINDETLAHRVCLGDFFIDIYEVSQSDYQRVTGKNPSKFPGCSSCPVEKVTWFEARDYCVKGDKRLPTEGGVGICGAKWRKEREIRRWR